MTMSFNPLTTKTLLFTALVLGCLTAGPLRAQTAPAASADDQERSITADKVTALVATTCQDIATDAPGTLAKITQGVAPYKDAANPTLYAFVYNPEVLVVAHPKSDLVGKSMKGKPDVRGNKFRDTLVERALAEPTGAWVDYVYQKPGQTGIFAKTVFCKKATGSDGQVYIVCAGMYKQ